MPLKERDKTRVLCIDHEGGRGGSSKSLFESIEVVDRTRLEVSVWCRRESHLTKAYEARGVATRVVADWPRFTPLDRFAPSVFSLMISAFRFTRFAGGHRALLEEIGQRFDVVHLNHETLFPLAWLIRRHSTIPISMHIRTVQFDTALSRWQTRMIVRLVDFLYFISANEQRNFRNRGGRETRQIVLTNIVNPVLNSEPLTTLPPSSNLLVSSIGNFSLENGTDRLIELAQTLQAWNRTDIHFVVAGQMRLPRQMRRQLPLQANAAETLSALAEGLGLSCYFTFLGHISNPQSVLDVTQIGIKLNRLGSNWGRDVLEALVSGVPILAVGQDKTFVRPGETGLLFVDYDPEHICEALVYLKDNPTELERLTERAKACAQEINNPAHHGATLTAQWQKLHRDGRAEL
ncbi:MAG: glycosyltransferase family 4 protein [Pseudomonadota bacterium]|nr:glycosyltransferase family 4 protein [Pseudomonadota bacterium]